MIFSYWFFLIIFHESKGSLQQDTAAKIAATRREISFDLIELWLLHPLRDLPHLHLEISVDKFQENIENSYTQWFLQQTILPITLSSFKTLNLVIHLMNPSTNTVSNRDNYVIVTNMENLRMSALQFVQRAGVFFFIVNGDINLTELRNIFHIMWRKFAVYKNFILTTEGVLIYDPFELNENGEYGQIVQYKMAASMDRTLFANMRGYPLRVQLFQSVYARPIFDNATNNVKHVEGVDGRVAHLMEERLNFTMILQDPDPDYFGVRFSNGSFNGAIGSIINNNLDICFNGFFVKDYLTTDIELSVAVYDDKLCIYTAKAQLIPKFILPIFSVAPKIWLCFIAMGILSSLMWSLLRRVNLRLHRIDIKNNCFDKNLTKSSTWQYVHIVNDTAVAWVRVALNYYPPFCSERVLVASICLVSVIFGAIFESSLATVYIYPMHFNDINTLQELDESGLSIFYKYSSMADDLFFSDTSALFKSLNRKLVFLTDFSFHILSDVAEKGGKAGVTRYNALMMESFDLIISKKIWIVPECPKYYTISYVWRRDAPWEESFNQMLLTFLSMGFIRKYIRDMEAEVETRIMVEHLYETQRPFRILTFEDLQLAFFVVIVGNFLATMVFIIEKIQRR